MKKLFKKSLTCLLAVIICLSLVPASVFAAESKGEVIDSGSCGENVTYTIYESGLMEISGTGDMKDYKSGPEVPFRNERAEIKEVVIGDGITSIGAFAFSYCRELTSITISDSVTSIGHDAFHYCDKLTNVTIPDSVTNIGSYAFSSCNILASIAIPDSVTSIGDYAFEYCRGLTSIAIPNSVTSIGDYAFEYCRGLTSIAIPNSVTSVGEGAFFGCKSLTSVTIGNNVKTIAKSTFWTCDNLTSVTIGGSVTDIGEGAFWGCYNLTSITIPNSVKSIGEDAFNNCSALTSITIPKSVTSIGDYAFWFCDGLKEIIFEGDAPTFSRYAFYCLETDAYFYCDRKGWSDASKIKGLSINLKPRHAKADEVGERCDACGEIAGWGVCISEGKCGDNLTARMYSEGILNITGTGDMYDYEIFYDLPYYDYCIDGIKEVVIDEGVTSIGDYAFSNCQSVTKISIPDSVKDIGEMAFDSCLCLTDINLPDSIESIAGNAFAYCSSLSFDRTPFPENVKVVGDIMLAGTGITEFAIPEGTKSIANSAFADCEMLKSVTIPESVTTIGSYAFQGCSKLTSITLPEGLTKIKDGAFSYCYKLKNVTLPDGLKSIGKRAFEECAIQTITIPDSVTLIDELAFDQCTSLKEIIFKGEAPAFKVQSFRGVTAAAYFPCVKATWTSSEVMSTMERLESIKWMMLHGEMKISEVSVTCTEDGYISAVCTDCGTEFKSNIVKAPGHNKVDGKCTVCGHVIDAPVIKASNVASSGKIKLTWDAVDDAVKYKVYRATSKNGKYSLMKTVTNGTSYTNTNATPGKYYYYYVLAVNADGIASEKSNIVGRTCNYAQPVVTATNDAATGKPKLTWKAVEGATSYKVYRATTKNGSYVLMKTVKDGATSYINANAVAGKMYYYKVKAYGANSSATSVYSAVDSRTCDLARLVVSITTSSGKPKLTWKAVSGATSYKVYRSTSKDGTYSLMKTVKGGATSYINTNAVAGKTYYYKVVAVHSNTNANSAKSAVKSIKCTK